MKRQTIAAWAMAAGAICMLGACSNGGGAPSGAAAPTTAAVAATRSTVAAPVLTSTAPSTSPQGNIIKAIGQAAWISSTNGQLNPATDAQFVVTKIAVVPSSDPILAEDGKAFEVMFHVKTGSDASLAQGLTAAILDSPMETTSAVNGEQLSPDSTESVGNPPDTFGTNSSYTFGYLLPLDKVEASGWLTVNANGGRGMGWDYRYSITK